MSSARARKSSIARVTPPLSVIRPVPDLIRSFPKTRYYGSKRKLLPWIYLHLSGVQFDTVLDAFGGTGSVSLLFKSMRKQVTYHDGLRFNEDVAKTVLANEIAMPRQRVAQFLESVVPCRGVIASNFRGVFYTDSENRWLDGFAEKLASSRLPAGSKAMLRHLLYQACLKKRPFNVFHRANLHLRTKVVTRSFGNLTTWNKTFQSHMLEAYDELAGLVWPARIECEVLSCGNVDDLKPGYDLVYLDPPYVSLEERYNADDYWRRYHFLEGLARYDEWGGLIDRSSRLRLFDAPPWIAEWSRKHSFEERLFSLVDKHKRSVVALSYVTDAFPSERRIKAFFESRFSNVSVHSAEHSHALSKSKKRELLFVGRPRNESRNRKS